MEEQKMIIQLVVLAIVAVWNIITFAFYAADKRKAEKKQWRISEATLIGIAFIMGAFGAFLGMRILRHKTQHIKFKVLVPLALLLNIAAIVLMFVLM